MYEEKATSGQYPHVPQVGGVTHDVPLTRHAL